MALEHRLMHAETLTYLLQNLTFDQKLPQAYQKVRSSPPPVNTPVESPAV